VPLVGSLINKLSEYVVEKQSFDAATNDNQVALIEKQNVILQSVSKDTSALLRGMMIQIGVLKDIKKTNKERARQGFFDKQRQAALEEESLLETKKDAVNVATKEVVDQKQDKDTSLFGMLGTLLKSITSLAAALLTLPSKIASAFKALLSLKNAISKLPLIARFFTMNPIGIGLLAGATLITLLARDKNPEETTKSILNAGTPDTAMAEAIIKTSEAPDAEKQAKKQNLLANRPKEKKSLLYWKDTKLQQNYLDEIGWDEKTGTTSEERNRAGRVDVRRMDNQAEAAQAQASPAPQEKASTTSTQASPALGENNSTASTMKPESADAQPMPMQPTMDQTEPVASKMSTQPNEVNTEPGVVPSPQTPTSGQTISQASTDVESMYTAPTSSKSGGLIVNTNNSSAASTPRHRSPIPSPIANRGSIDNFAFSAI
jgi:hypothetical protein